MLALRSDLPVHLACGITDLRNSMEGLAVIVQEGCHLDPFAPALFAFSWKGLVPQGIPRIPKSSLFVFETDKLCNHREVVWFNADGYGVFLHTGSKRL